MAKINDKTELFETAPIGQAVLTLSVPTIISSLVMVVYNLADTYFVGLLNDPVQTAAVTLAATALLAFNAINNLFGVGTSSAMSRALGQKDYDAVKRSSVFGFYCALLSAILLSVICFVWCTPLLKILGADATTMDATTAYFKWAVICGAVPSILNVVFAYLVRSEGAALHASIGTMSGCILNIILDPIFIMPWGLNMGSAGAGLATCLSNCFACLYFLVLLYVKRKNTLVCINPKLFSFNGHIARKIFGVGIPAAVQNLLNVTGLTILNNFTAAYGPDAVAAMGIAHRIQMVPMQVALGASQGVMPFIGYNYAAGQFKRMRDAILYVLKRSVGLLVVVAGAYILFAPQLMHLFIQSQSVIDYGAKFLVGFALTLPFFCIDFTGVGVFQAIGDGKKALVFAFLRKIVLEIPALFLLNFIWPLYGMAYSTLFAEVVLSAAAVYMLRNILSGKTGPHRAKDKA